MSYSYRFAFSLLLALASFQVLSAVPGQWQDAFYLSPGCDSPVLAMAERPDGKVYIGGGFLFCDGVKVNRIALFDPVANTYEPLQGNDGTGVNAPVRALAWADGDLYVGGDMTIVGGLDANRVARWDGSSWHRLGNALSNGVAWSDWEPAQVMALAWVDGDLYVGGLFDSAGTIQANHIARWSAGQWHTLGAGPDNGVSSVGAGELSTPVRALQPLGGNLIVGGYLDTAGGNPANRLAMWNGASWSTVGEGPVHGPGIWGHVHALALDGNDLYVGGRMNFEDASGNVCSTCVMQWNGSNWLGLPFGDEASLFNVTDLAVHNGQLYAATGSSVRGEGLRRWSGSQWQVMGDAASVGRGDRLLSINQGLLVGGLLGSADGQPIHGIVRWADNQFHAAGQAGGQGSERSVLSVVEHDGQIYAAKSTRVARWDGGQWHFLPGEFNRQINALTVYQDMLYAGGGFFEIDGAPALRIVRFDGTEWLPVGGGLPSESAVTQVSDFTVANGLLYVAGRFEQAGSVPANSIAAWNGSSWSALSTLAGNGLEQVVGNGTGLATALSLTSHGGNVYVGGDFTLAGGVAASRVARWDGSNWFSVAGGFNSGFIDALSWHDGQLYAGGGGLTDGQGNALGALARVNSGLWQAVGSLPSPSRVLDLFSHDSWLYVAGSRFQPMEEDRLARWDGQQWQRFGSGITEGSSNWGGVQSVFVTDERVSIGGYFQQAGPHASSFFGIFDFIELGDMIFSDRFGAGPSE